MNSIRNSYLPVSSLNTNHSFVPHVVNVKGEDWSVFLDCENPMKTICLGDKGYIHLYPSAVMNDDEHTAATTAILIGTLCRYR